MKRKLAALAVTIAAGLGVTATQLGGTTSPCPTGHSYMGCSIGAAKHPAHDLQNLRRATVTAPVPGCVFPDVSSFQGHPGWSAASGSICAAVAKAGEGGVGEDPDFAWNVGQLRALHIPWSAYWFVRGCDEGPSFVDVLNSIRFRGDRDALRPVLDMEVPSAAGCAVPMANAIHRAFGLWPIIYTAPGTWPGGSSGALDTWEADYGSVLERLPFASTVLAWQRYSPPFTFRSVPGLGTIDESIDLRGFSKQLAFPAPPPKPDPFLIYPLKPIRLYGEKVSERRTVERWWSRSCSNPVKREVCVVTRRHLEWFAGRLVTLAEQGQERGEFNLPPNWSSKRARELKWPQRHFRIERILKGSGR